MLTQEIGIFEAKSNLSQIIDKAANGADFVITRRGKPVAKIIPFKKEQEMTYKEAIAGLLEMRKLYRGEPGSFNIREAIEEGRR